ncbi:hypothetical protein IKG06_01855 [Candidatus Saccharibacteria bacterium]|nr:hypothetical protein [Candidatus Saccharibacteria bacterium]
MNNDELQRAIDDITKDNAPAEAVPAVGSAAENEQLANELDQTVAPAVGPTITPETPDFGVAPTPVVPDAPGMPPVETTEAVATMPEAPVAPAAPVVETAEPVAEAAPATAEDADGDTLNEALKELYPLLDKVDIPVEEKFDITMKFGSPAKALDIAKQMTDETAKANALLEIVNKLK